MTVNLTEARTSAQQLIAFADGYSEAASFILSEAGMASDIGRGARRMRSVAYDLLRLADEVEFYRLAVAEGTFHQGSLFDP